ncbi:MAG: hypothetical protein ABS79_00165 [Planctomycetes bacterium SCN 63-9]|nr:MAG: hypothetical protein ABS79_00165 [Planctomycetes bacterium SCN 63-9]
MNTRILRERQDEASSALDRARVSVEQGGLTALAQTLTISTYPTSPSSYFACRPLLVDGSESEGATASFSPDSTRTFYAYNVGTQTPPPGTKLLLTCCGGRWIFRYDG